MLLEARIGQSGRAEGRKRSEGALLEQCPISSAIIGMLCL